MLTLAILIMATLSSGFAYATFYKQVIDRETQPNRWSWLIWSVTAWVEAATYEAVSGDEWKSIIFFASAICCTLTTLAIWTRAEWEPPTVTEFLTIFATGLALFIWFHFNEAWWAHLVMIAAVPMSFFPEWGEAWKKPQSHRPLAWALWVLGDFCALLVVILRLESFKELPYAIIEFSCHYLMLFIICARRGF